MCKVCTGYCGTSEIEHGLCACTVDNPLAKAQGLSLRTGAHTMLYLSLVRIPQIKPSSIFACLVSELARPLDKYKFDFINVFFLNMQIPLSALDCCNARILGACFIGISYGCKMWSKTHCLASWSLPSVALLLHCCFTSTVNI